MLNLVGRMILYVVSSLIICYAIGFGVAYIELLLIKYFRYLNKK